MPNWCENQLTIKGPKEDLDNITINYTQDPEGDANIIDMVLDLNKIAPRPEGEDGNWYEWCIRNWGTKWNIENCGCSWHRNSNNEIHTEFNTAWAPCLEAIDKLAELFPKLKMIMKYCEPGCGFAGKRVWEKGIMKSDYQTENPKDKIFKELIGDEEEELPDYD